ncbi:hypothetical protein AB4Z17_09860 [Paenibacillus sp. TAF43_2]|uniref:hypothetical protein n=1 Tax=Paenibacillus sp. TAF43_2 TaxID=3233069 RepID=UPI003F964A99
MNLKKFSISQFIIIIAISLFSLSCLFPFIMVISGSLSTEKDIMDYGYTLWPKSITFDSYRILFLGSNRIIDAYGVSLLVTVAGTILSLLVTSMGAYVMARRSFKYRNILSIYVIITMLFNGGLVPCIRYAANISTNSFGIDQDGAYGRYDWPYHFLVSVRSTFFCQRLDGGRSKRMTISASAV